jgi:hypothetical protein
LDWFFLITRRPSAVSESDSGNTKIGRGFEFVNRRYDSCFPSDLSSTLRELGFGPISTNSQIHIRKEFPSSICLSSVRFQFSPKHHLWIEKFKQLHDSCTVLHRSLGFLMEEMTNFSFYLIKQFWGIVKGFTCELEPTDQIGDGKIQVQDKESIIPD